MTDQSWFKIVDAWMAQPTPYEFSLLILNWIIPLLALLALIVIINIIINGNE